MDLTPLFTRLDFHWPYVAISAFAFGPALWSQKHHYLFFVL